MLVKEARRNKGSVSSRVLPVVFGGLTALGVELIFLLAGSVAVATGVIRMDATPQVVAAACLVGCLIGGRVTCIKWKTRRLIGGILAGLMAYLIICVIALMSGIDKIGLQAVVEFFSCAVGGGLAGIFPISGRKHRRKVH